MHELDHWWAAIAGSWLSDSIEPGPADSATVPAWSDRCSRARLAHLMRPSTETGQARSAAIHESPCFNRTRDEWIRICDQAWVQGGAQLRSVNAAARLRSPWPWPEPRPFLWHDCLAARCHLFPVLLNQSLCHLIDFLAIISPVLCVSFLLRLASFTCDRANGGLKLAVGILR